MIHPVCQSKDSKQHICCDKTKTNIDITDIKGINNCMENLCNIDSFKNKHSCCDSSMTSEQQKGCLLNQYVYESGKLIKNAFTAQVIADKAIMSIERNLLDNVQYLNTISKNPP